MLRRTAISGIQNSSECCEAVKMYNTPLNSGLHIFHAKYLSLLVSERKSLNMLYYGGKAITFKECRMGNIFSKLLTKRGRGSRVVKWKISPGQP